jgi:hypothetical protein
LNIEGLFTRISKRLKYQYSNFLRIKVPHKIVIIESDDWGLERCINPVGFERLCLKYPEPERTRWFYDSLETKYDLDRLFGLLESYAGSFRNKPIITGNFITHNIDYSINTALQFKGISENHQLPKESYLEGIDKKLLFPQLHGYSHYNTTELNKYFSDSNGREDFMNGFFVAVNTTRGNTGRFHGEYSNMNLNFKSEISTARLEFKKAFNFSSLSVIPCTFILDDEVQQYLEESDIKIIQGANRLTDSNGTKRNLPLLRLQRNVFYNIRNARLDIHPDYEKFANVDLLIKSMETAFEYQKPCVIDFHRVNFVSEYSREWSDKCLNSFNLFFKYCRRHPDLVFMNTVEFHNYVKNGCRLEY